MDYKIKIGSSDEILVDFLEFGAATEGYTEGWPEVYISVRDSETDIYADKSKKAWIEWLNEYCGEKDNPEKRIVPVVAKIYSDDGKVYRTFTIENAYLASYEEVSTPKNHSYVAEVRRADSRKGDINIKASDE